MRIERERSTVRKKKREARDGEEKAYMGGSEPRSSDFQAYFPPPLGRAIERQAAPRGPEGEDDEG